MSSRGDDLPLPVAPACRTIYDQLVQLSKHPSNALGPPSLLVAVAAVVSFSFVVAIVATLGQSRTCCYVDVPCSLIT